MYAFVAAALLAFMQLKSAELDSLIASPVVKSRKVWIHTIQQCVVQNFLRWSEPLPETNNCVGL